MAVVKKTKVKKVKATNPTPAAETKPAITGEPAEKKAKKVKEPKASKYRGATTGMRVMEYQDSTFQANVKAMLTDEELAANWRKEFPNAVAFTPAHVGGARRDYNKGTHAKMTPKPATPLAQVIIEDGKRRFVTDDESAAEKKARTEAKVAKTKATKAARGTGKAAQAEASA